MSVQALARAVAVADAAVVALVQAGSVTRIYPVILPQDVTLPAVTLQQVSSVTAYTHDDPALVRVRLQVDSWASSYASARSVAKALRDAFHGYAGVADGIQDFEAVNDRDLFEDVVDSSGQRRLYRVSSDYLVTVRDVAA